MQHQQQQIGGSSVGRERLLRAGSVQQQQLMSQKNNGYGGQGGVSYLDQETRAPLEELIQGR